MVKEVKGVGGRLDVLTTEEVKSVGWGVFPTESDDEMPDKGPISVELDCESNDDHTVDRGRLAVDETTFRFEDGGSDVGDV